MAQQEEWLDNGRIQALADGVFAIVMTLLVIELHVPDVASSELLHEIASIWPSIMVFFITFVILGIFWFGHRLMFHYITKSSRKLIWLNIFFFMFISIIPFSASLLGKYPSEQAAVVIYGANLIFAGLALYAMWTYSISRSLTVQISDGLKNEARKQLLFAPIVYTLAIAVSFYATWMSVLIYILTPVFYLLSSSVDRHLPGRKNN